MRSTEREYESFSIESLVAAIASQRRTVQMYRQARCLPAAEVEGRILRAMQFELRVKREEIARYGREA